MKYQAIIFDLFGTLVPNMSLSEHRAILTRMAVIALKELMVPAHHKVIYRKMQELFPRAKLDTGSFNNVLSNRLFQWVDRGTYGLAECSFLR